MRVRLCVLLVASVLAGAQAPMQAAWVMNAGDSAGRQPVQNLRLGDEAKKSREAAIGRMNLPKTEASPVRLKTVAAEGQAQPKPEQWTPVSHSWINDEGKGVTEVFAAPHFQRTQTGWKELSGALTQQKDRKFPWVASDVAVPVEFGAGKSAAIRLSIPRGEISLRLNGAAELAPVVDRTSKVAGTVSYSDVLPGVDLGYAPYGAGVKEALRIKSADAAREFVFTVADPEHLLGNPTRNADESYTFSGAVGDGLVMSFGAPMAWSIADAADRDGRTPSGQAGDENAPVSVVPGTTAHQEVVATADGYEVRLSLDEDWVAGQEFPVVLDPSITLSAKGSLLSTGFGLTLTSSLCGDGYCPLASVPSGGMFIASDWWMPAYEYAGYVHANLGNFGPGSVSEAVLSLGYDECSSVSVGRGVEVVPMGSALAPGDSWGDAEELPRSVVNVPVFDEDLGDWVPNLVEEGLSGYALHGMSIGFGGVEGRTRGGFDRHTVDVTDSVQDRLIEHEGAGVGFLVRIDTNPAGRMALLESRVTGCPAIDSWVTGDPPADGGWFYDASLVLTGPGPMPAAIPVPQTFGCECVFQRGASLTNQVADPVNTANGHAVETFVDLQTLAPGVPFNFVRAYNGLDTSDGPMGVGWAHPYAASLTENPLTGDVTFRDPSGGSVVFTALPGGTYAAAPGSDAVLESIVGDAWKLTGQSGEVLGFDATGQLSSWVDRNGRGLDFAYSGSGSGARLTSLTDEVGREVSFSYGSSGDGEGRLLSVSTDDGRATSYGYDTIAGDIHLVESTDAEGVVTRYDYDPTTGRLSGVTVGDGETGAQNVYDGESGRISEQTDAAGNTWQFEWEPSEDPAAPEGSGTQTSTDPEGNTITDVYFGNVLIEHTDAEANTTKYWYDANDNLIAAEDARGFVSQRVYDARGNLIETISPEPEAAVESWTYNADNQVASHTDPLGNVTTYDYDNGLLAAETDALGHETTYTYTSLGLLETVTTPEGRTTEYGYDADGNRIRETSPGGAVTTHAYDDAGRVVSSTSPRGNEVGSVAEDFTTHYSYDDRGAVLSMTDPRDTVTTNTYNEDGTLDGVAVVDSDNNVIGDTAYTHDEMGRVLTVAEFGRTTMSSEYDKVGNLVASTDAEDAKTTYTYTGTGQVATMTTPNGNDPESDPGSFTWRYEYDEVDNLLRTIGPDDRIEGTVYDALSRTVQSYVSEVGADPAYATNVFTTEYDASGNQTAKSDPDGVTRYWSYDEAGRMVATSVDVLDPTTYVYDDDGRRVSETSPTGASTTTWSYGADGEVATVVDPNGNAPGANPSDHMVSYSYDVEGNALSRTDQLGHTTSWTYDAIGNKVSETDARGNTQSWTYDALGRMRSATTPGATGGTTSYGYDDYGDLITRTDPKGNSYSLSYDKRHQLTDIVDPLDRHQRYTYDAAGNRISRILAQGLQSGADPDEWTVDAYYDARGNMTGETAPDGTWSYFFYDQFGVAYAESGSQDKLTITKLGHTDSGKLSAVETSRKGWELVPDPAQSEPQECEDEDDPSCVPCEGDDCFILDWIDTNEEHSDYTYDSAGRISSTSYSPGGTVVNYSYDGDGRVSGLEDNGALSTYEYTPAGQLSTLTYPTEVGLIQQRVYDHAGQVLSVDTRAPSAAHPTSRIEYARDNVGSPIEISRTRGTDVAYESETYDELNRLTKYCPGVSSCSAAAAYAAYTYDENGNRTQQDRVGLPSPGTVEYSYDDADQLVAVEDGAGSTTFQYDAQGRLTSDGREWNFFDRLVASDVGGTATFEYDAFGNLTRQAAGGVTSAFAWDLNNSLPMLAIETTVSATEATTQTTAYNPDASLLDAEHYGADYSRTYFATDALGSVTDTFGDDGTALTQTDYEPFGEVVSSTDLVTDPVDHGFGFTGALHNDATGDEYLRARNYLPELGRFDSRDPVEQSLDGSWLSSYAYAGNMPTRYADPSGLCWLPDWMCEAGETVVEAPIEAIEGGAEYLEGTMSNALNGVPGAESWQDYGQADIDSGKAKMLHSAPGLACWFLPLPGLGGYSAKFAESKLIRAMVESRAASELSTAADEAVFWSGVGRGGEKIAAAWTAKNGGSTLETTLAARGIELPAWNPSDATIVSAWREASAAFARGARGDVRVLQSSSVRADSIWATVEFPALKANSGVTSITAISPETGVAHVIWRR